jgi:TonB family protein
MGPGAYPWLSTVLGEQGDTMLGFTIQPDGSVTDVHVVPSSGSSRLDSAAVEGAKAWLYNPALQNGKPVSVPWTTTVNWRLDTSQFAMAGFPFVRALREDFPSESLKRRESGVTVVGLRVSPSGQIVGADIYRSSGHDELDSAAVRLALSRIQAKPGEVDGKPVMTMVTLFVVWAPDDAATASK